MSDASYRVWIGLRTRWRRTVRLRRSALRRLSSIARRRRSPLAMPRSLGPFTQKEWRRGCYGPSNFSLWLRACSCGGFYSTGDTLRDMVVCYGTGRERGALVRLFVRTRVHMLCVCLLGRGASAGGRRSHESLAQLEQRQNKSWRADKPQWVAFADEERVGGRGQLGENV